jgi:hypothetical protein
LHIGFAMGNVALERQVGAGPVLESADFMRIMMDMECPLFLAQPDTVFAGG